MVGEKRPRGQVDNRFEQARQQQSQSNQDRGRGSAYSQSQGERGPDRGGRNDRSAHQYPGASTSALASGVQNAVSHNSRGSWYVISRATDSQNYYTDINIEEIIKLTNEGLKRPDQLCKILNKAPHLGTNSALQRIIKGWGDDKLSDMLKTVIAQVGAEYKIPNKANKKGSIEISLIFNAFSKIPGDGKEVEKFYDKIDSKKWQQIIPNANAQEISLIFNALSKIKDDGKKVEKFYDEVSGSGKWQQILPDANAQNITNIFNALSKINDGGAKVKEFYVKIGGQKGLDKIILDANAQNIANIFNALPKIPGEGLEAKEFFSKIKPEKWQQILSNANSLTVSNIFNALSKINYDGAKVKEFYDEVSKSEKWKKILPDANAQDISNILNALSKIPGNGDEVKKIYDEVSRSGKLEQIIPDADAQAISNIFNALSKINDDGTKVGEFCEKISTSGRLRDIIYMSNVEELLNIIKALANSEEGVTRLKDIYDKIASTRKLERIIADPNSDSSELDNILTSFSKSREASKFMGNLCNDIYLSRPDFLSISKIMCALNGIEEGGAELVKKFYNNTKENYTKTGEKLLKDYPNYIKNPKAILLDLHGFTHDAAEIVIKSFLDEARKSGNPIFIECGRSSHSLQENVGKMPVTVEVVVIKEGFHVSPTNQLGLLEVNKELDLGRVTSISTNLGGSKALDTNTLLAGVEPASR